MPDGDLRTRLEIDVDAGRAVRGVRRTRDEVAGLARTVRGSGRAASRSARLHNQLAAANVRLERSARRASGAFSLFTRLGVGFAGFGIAGLGRSIVQTAASFEQLRLRLRVFEGDAASANARFAELQEYAATTPFSLLDVVNAFLRLEATNFEPDLQSFRSLGDIASASGRSVLELADAIAAVGRGENDPIEGFGFEVRKQGKDVRIAFRDTVRVVKNSRTEILRAFQEIGEAKFTGATEELADSLTGALSNLGDAFDQLQDQAGQGGLSAAITELSRDLADTAGGAQATARALGALAGAAVSLIPTVAYIGGGFIALRLHLGFAALATRTYMRATRAAAGPIATTGRRLAALARGGRAATAAMHGLRRATYLLGGPFGVALLAAEAIGLLAFSLRDSADAADALEGSTERALAAAGKSADLARAQSNVESARQAVTQLELEVDRLERQAQEAANRASEGLLVEGVRLGLPDTLKRAREDLDEARSDLATYESIHSELTRHLGRIPEAEGGPAEDVGSPEDDRIRKQIEAALQNAADLERLAAAREDGEEAYRAVQRAIEREQAERKALAQAEDTEDELLRKEAAGAALRETAARHLLDDAEREAKLRTRAAEVRARSEAFLQDLQREADVAAAGAEAARLGREAYERWERELEIENAGRAAVASLVQTDSGAAGTERADQARALAEQAERQRQATDAALEGGSDASETFVQAAVSGLRTWAEETRNRARDVREAVTGAMSDASDAFVQFALTGKASVGDLVQSIIYDLARLHLQHSVTGPLAAALAGALGAAAPAPTGPFAYVPARAPVGHGGLVVGQAGGRVRNVDPSVFLRAPRAHGGLDLAAGEVPIIAERGERVLSRAERRELGRPVEVVINHTNQGTPQRLRATGTQVNPRQVILDVVSDDITRGGQTFRALQARGTVV